MEYCEHKKSSKKQLGKSYSDVHYYIDHFFEAFGIGHRLIFHHKLGIEKIVSRFGEEARQPAELHIREDLEGFLPEDWSYYGNPIFVSLEVRAKIFFILREVYGQEVFQKVMKKYLIL